MGRKTILLSIFIALLIFLNSTTAKAQSPSATETPKYKVTILYPNGDDKTFDMDYYQTKHMPMVAGFLGDNLKFYEIDKGISGRTPQDKPPFAAIGYFYINDIAEYGKAIAQNRETVIGDIKNYTNIQPVIQISEVKQVRR